MKLETTPEIRLDGILEQKAIQKEQLHEKLNTLLNYKLAVSYTLELTTKEQISLAKFGLYSLTYDSMYYGRNYANRSI